QIARTGITLTAVRNGKPLTDEEVAALPAAARDRLAKNRTALSTRVERTGKTLADLDARTRAALRKLRDDAVGNAIGHLAAALAASYEDVAGVARYLKELEQDILENADLFADGGADEPV